MARVTALAGGAARDVETTIDRDQVRAIVGARWRIAWRRASEKWWKLVLVIVGITGFYAFVGVLSVGAFFVTREMRDHEQFAHLVPPALHAAFLISLLSLAVSPALGLRGNEFLDATKLFIHPVSHRTVFAASLLTLLTSNSVVLFTLPLLGAVAGWGGGAAAVAGGCLVVLASTAVGVALGQTGLLLFLDLFRSRKWRDFSRLAVALLSAGLYAGVRVASGRMSGGFEAGLAKFGAVTDWMMPLPSWWAANAIVGGGALRWLPACALPVLLVWLVRLAAHLQERTYFGEVEEKRSVVAASGGGFAGWFGARFRGPLGACVEKDLRVLLREPSVRIQLIQQFAYAIVPLFAAVWSSGSRAPGSGPPGAVIAWMHAGFPYLAVMLTLGFLTNPLGTEGAGLQHALLTPVPRSTLLLSKTLALAAVLGAASAILTAVGSGAVAAFAEFASPAAIAGRAALAALEALAIFGVFAGVGSVLGAAWPVRVVSRDRRALSQQTAPSRQGCLPSLGRMAGFAVSGALSVPVGLAFHHPAISRAFGGDTSAYLVLTVPAALAWGGFAAWMGSRFGGALLGEREESALAGMTRSEE